MGVGLRTIWGRSGDVFEVFQRTKGQHQVVNQRLLGARRAGQSGLHAGELGDGFFPGRGNFDELAALFEHARHCAEESGRDPEALEFTAGGPTSPDYVERLAEIGVTRMIVPPMDPSQFSKFGEEVISQFSSF